MKKLSIFLLFAMALVACSSNTGGQYQEKPRDGVFFHITHDHSNPHRVLMPLRMAQMMAADKDVLVYLDIDAVKLVTKDADDLHYHHFIPLKESIQNLLEMGVGIYACPGCMQVYGISETDLMDGVQVAQKDAFFDFTEGRILTLDY